MPIAQRQTGPSSFRTETPSHLTGSHGESHRAVVASRASQPAPVPSAPRPRVHARPRHRTQTAWYALTLFSAFGAFILGLAYLSGPALVTKEGYRRAQLKGMQRREQELAMQWNQRMAVAHTQRIIENKARGLGMVPADSQPTVTVGEIAN